MRVIVMGIALVPFVYQHLRAIEAMATRYFRARPDVYSKDGAAQAAPPAHGIMSAPRG
jgi:hypothetical protein